VIVASFFAPRPEHPRWRDYLPSLRLLQASCDRLGLQHVVLGDTRLEGFDVLTSPLPRDLMPAFLEAQRHGIETLDDDILLVGADCVIGRDPSAPFAAASLTVTLGDFWDCRMNTGAIWVRRDAREAAAELWTRALDGMGLAWGDDQLALADQVGPLPNLWRLPTIEDRLGLSVQFLPVDPWNLAPDNEAHDCSHGVVLHFRGNRKEWSGRWCRRFLGFDA
jgi:hypothetical protein